MPIYVANFPGHIYNCEKPFYTLSPLPESVILSGIIFSSKASIPSGNGMLAIALNLNSELNDSNYYKSVERIKNLICLSYTSIPQELPIQETYTSLEDAVEKNISNYCYNPEVRFGFQLSWDLPMRVAAYCQKINRLSNKNRKKFWAALQTFCYARQIAYLPNPQYKYTLYMTLHLASINQLANNPKNLHEPSKNLFCPVCEKEVNLTHQTSHVEEIVKLIENLIPLEYQQTYIKIYQKAVSPYPL